jgi:uncharacterized protein (DUF58 family)
MAANTWPPLFWKLSYWQQWFRVAKASNHITILNPRQIYILPTRWGLLYAVMVIALLVGSINYSLSLGYYVTFLLASLGNMAMLHTWRNLLYLQIKIVQAQPVFAGDIGNVVVQVSDYKNQARYAVAAHFIDNNAVVYNIAANSACPFVLPLETKQRGYHNVPRITLYTEFPLSLLNAWSVIENPFQVLVYPKPIFKDAPLPISADNNAQGSPNLNVGDDDFFGHKTYQTGDPPSRVDWKASSRGIGLFTKQYNGAGASQIWLDWANTSGDKETRLSQLCGWIINAHHRQTSFGLRLPNQTLPPNNNEAHYHQALTLLAVMP